MATSTHRSAPKEITLGSKLAAPEGTLPRYTPDDGPLTTKRQNAIRRLQQPGRMRVKQSLL